MVLKSTATSDDCPKIHSVIDIKTPPTEYGVAGFITARFSPRAFSERDIEPEILHTLFEVASWAPSTNNEQPWEYFYAFRDTDGFERITDCLMAGNKPWAKNAAVLVVSVLRKTFALNGRHNSCAEHDLGMANATLLLQARAVDIFGHPIGGFDRQAAALLLDLDENRVPFCIFALGYLGHPDSLEEPYRSRENAARTRKKLSEFVRKL